MQYIVFVINVCAFFIALFLNVFNAYAQNTGGVPSPIVQDDISRIQHRVGINFDNSIFATRMHYDESFGNKKMWRLVAQGRDREDYNFDLDFLQGKVFWQITDDGKPYPTGFHFDGLEPSYYISQNLIQYRDHPKGTMARIPAHEIEKTVTEALRDWVTDIENWQTAFPNAPESHHNWLIENLLPVRSRFVKSILKRGTVHAQNLKIDIDAKKLSSEIAEHSEIAVGESVAAIITIETPFKTYKAKNGAIIVNGATHKSKDPLDLPSDQLRGIVWRDKHFAGATLKDIARAGRYSDDYVNKCIQESFEFLSQ